VTTAVPLARAVDDAEILRAIQAGRGRQQRSGSVTALRRRPWEYATSTAVELITAVMDDGTECEFVLKHLGPSSLSEGARRAKPSFVIDSQREIEVYRTVLAPLEVGPVLTGFGIAPRRGVYWLLVEYVHGRRLFEVGERECWAAVGRWLGDLQRRFATLDRDRLRREARLIEYDREWYRVWLQRALRFFASTDPPHSRHGRDALLWLAGRYDKVIERLISMPPTIIHGEFYPSNVLVGATTDDSRVWPVDWEMASEGPGIIDVAALTSGAWLEGDRRAVLTAYVAGLESRGDAVIDDVAESLDYARIHLAIQWLGWFGRREAPGEHAHDWLAEAVERAEALRL
jgi:hypothetical protein